MIFGDCDWCIEGVNGNGEGLKSSHSIVCFVFVSNWTVGRGHETVSSRKHVTITVVINGIFFVLYWLISPAICTQSRKSRE